MMKFLRSQSQTVLVVVLGVIGLSFIFYGNSGNLLTNGGGRGGSDFGRIEGQDLTVAELTEAVHNTRYSLIIHGQAEQLKKPGASKQIAEQAWSQLLLLREADRLHINISVKELVEYVHKQPLFQKDGVYDPETYKKVMGELRDYLHIPADSGGDSLAATQAIFEQIFRDDLRIQAVSKALFSTTRSSAHDVGAQYEKLYSPVTVSLIKLDSKQFITTAQVAPADIEGEYKAHPENPAYRTKEKRKVDYVLFLLSPDQLKGTDKDKAAAKDALGQKALDFALAFQPEPTASGQTPPPTPDFLTVANKQGLNPATTDFFTVDTAPANVPPSPAFNSAAFALTKDNTISKVVELANGVAVLHLAEIQPSELRPLDEVRADIAKSLQETSGLRSAQLTAQIMSKTIQSTLEKNPDFKKVASDLKYTVETLPSFVPINASSTDQRLQAIAYATLKLKPGEVSEPIPLPDHSILIAHLDNRGAPDPAGLADFEKNFRESQDEQLRELVFTDWAEWKSKQPGTHKPPDLESFGSVE